MKSININYYHLFSNPWLSLLIAFSVLNLCGKTMISITIIRLVTTVLKLGIKFINMNCSAVNTRFFSCSFPYILAQYREYDGYKDSSQKYNSVLSSLLKNIYSSFLMHTLHVI